ncbi:Similar to SLC22A8: Solute carrier family 22 member 8 (Oryctolagus cuniculus) [Cotesia congregata]|uniref:Similar to SLC22A8: Solute carrier family 22 member 8 (Oryctolagus cuniculus) n=1 Tax=Cotesia congregata TaxID=51543 RepID=A0A8J2E3R8_COTCN|nr:Similar to SLC22A8: Solute carrier family 22 member 8 (Oryctolagus cuniculus) [Cotesia congregata]
MSIEDTKVGYFQFILLFLLGINYIIVAMSHTLTIYHNYTPKFYCEASNGLNKTYGCINNTYNGTFRVCGINDYNFEMNNSEKSIITDWGLICERSYLKEYSIIAYCVGVSIGAWITGILVDRIGRLPVLAICLYSQGTMTVATYIVQSYPVFLILRSLQGVFAQGLQNSTYILALELFPTKYRTLVSTVMSIAWAFGLLLLTAFGYFIRDWRILQLAISVPTAITVLYIWMIPESPRWLLTRNKTTEADIALERIIKYNKNCCFGIKFKQKVHDSKNAPPVKSSEKLKSEILIENNEKCNNDPDEVIKLLKPTTSKSQNSRSSLRVASQNLEERLSDPSETFVQITENNSNNNEIFEPSEKNTQITTISQDKFNLKNETAVVKDNENIEPIGEITKKKYCLFKNSYFIKYLTIITCQWLSISTMRSFVIDLFPNFTKNRYVDLTINNLAEIIIYIVMYFILSRHGRRLPIIIFQVFNFIFCISIAVHGFLPYLTVLVNDVLKIILLSLGRVSSISALAIIYLYTNELFPTTIRGTCFGLFIIISTVGNTSGPYILLLMNNISSPLIFNGIFNLISAILCYWLPETINDCLPDNLSDMIMKKSISNKNYQEKKTNGIIEQEILRKKLFSEDWVDAGNGIIVNFTDSN